MNLFLNRESQLDPLKKQREDISPIQHVASIEFKNGFKIKLEIRSRFAQFKINQFRVIALMRD